MYSILKQERQACVPSCNSCNRNASFFLRYRRNAIQISTLQPHNFFHGTPKNCCIHNFPDTTHLLENFDHFITHNSFYSCLSVYRGGGVGNQEG